MVGDTAVGYIDSAIPGTQLRMRADTAYGNTQPGRAEFFWPVGGSFGPGPGADTRVDYQDLLFYAESQIMASPWMSVFGEMPLRWINPELVDNTAGLSDVNCGVKCALLTSSDAVYTLQFRTFVPTGDRQRGVGTGHVSLEPALLFYHQISPEFTLEGELRDWIAVGGSEGFAGNVLRYGLGAGYDLVQCCDSRSLRAVLECVGWTVLNGQSIVASGPPLTTMVVDAQGDTIVNAKIGLRWRASSCYDVYVGYGRALTDERWYDDIARIELRRFF
jgi:hypothetical protein